VPHSGKLTAFNATQTRKSQFLPQAIARRIEVLLMTIVTALTQSVDL
jgi:hypothetical protein